MSGGDWKFLVNSYALILLLYYTNWHSNISYFRKPDVSRYHKCSTFSKTGRAISRIGHIPFDLILLRLTWQRVVSTLRPRPFFFDTILQMIAQYSLLTFTQFNYFMPCSACVLLLPYPSLFNQRKLMSFFFRCIPRGVLNKVLHGEGPSRGPATHPFIYHFRQKRHSLLLILHLKFNGLARL